MNKRLKCILIAGTAAIVAVLIVSNYINYSDKVKYKQELEGSKESSSLSSLSESDYSTTSDTDEELRKQIDDLQQQLDSYKNNDGSFEDEIQDVSKKFLEAYYTRDSNRSEEDAAATYDGLITEKSLNSMASKLKQAPAGEGVRVYKNLIACKTYVDTQSSERAAVFCCVYIKDSFEYDDAQTENRSNNTSYLIRLSVVKEESGWLVDDIELEQSLYAVTNFSIDTVLMIESLS